MIDSEFQKKLNAQFNPEGSALRKAQYRMLDLLNFLHEVCEMHKLRYWLDGGTLLGAARHGGFIPWDDDADVCMPREDALELQRILGNEVHAGHVILQSTASDGNYSNSSWMTLRDLDSRYVQNRYAHNILKYQGVQIDIFMLENNVPVTIKKISNILHDFLVYGPLENKHNLKFLRPFVRINHRILDNVAYPLLRVFKKSDNTMTYGIGTPFNNRYNKHDIFPLGKIKFEGVEFYSPHNPDIYLKDLYGDWEKIPATDQIETHADNIVFKTDYR